MCSTSSPQQLLHNSRSFSNYTVVADFVFVFVFSQSNEAPSVTASNLFKHSEARCQKLNVRTVFSLWVNMIFGTSFDSPLSFDASV